VAQQVVENTDRVATQRTAVLPTFAEAEFQVAHSRSVDRQLRVMPRRPRPVDRRHRLVLPVTGVLLFIAPAVTQVDAAHEGHVAFGAGCVPDDHELLVMRAAQSNALVEEDLTAGCVHLLPEVAVLPGAEAEPIQV
jgi:hypothetical protein